MEKLDGKTLDLMQMNIEKLKELFPEVIVEGKIDFEMLKILLGENVETFNEKYQFSWIGKKQTIKFAQTPSIATLIPSKSKSKEWENTKNLYIEGDNVEVLKLLQKTYFGKIKMIYIDPPYNTGNDFVYKDDFKSTLLNYKEITSQSLRANPSTNGRFHTDWLNMMYSRLLLAKNLLSENGVIFISIDDNEVANLRKICDEIFGESNFVANLIWQKKFSRSNDATYFSTMHDHILCYCKENLLYSENGWKIGLLPRNGELPDGYSNPDNDPRGPWTSTIMSAKSGSESSLYEIITPSGRSVYPPSGRYWSCSKETYQKWLEDNRIWFGKDGDGTPRKKTFLSEVQPGLRPNSILFQQDVGNNQDAKQEMKELFNGIGLFDGPKPVKLIKTLLKIANLERDDIILDFFSGSATTAQAVYEYNVENNSNLKFIMIQLPELCEEGSEAYKNGYKNICEIGEERIRRSGQKIYNELKEKYDNAGLLVNECVNLDVLDFGFKVFKLESTNIKPWDGSHKIDDQTIFDFKDTIKEDRTNIDVAYEIMLKYGIFNMPLKEVQINNKTMYNIGEGFMIICLEDEVTIEDVTEIAKQKPHCVVFKEEGFEDDNVKINATYTLERMGVEDVKCI